MGFGHGLWPRIPSTCASGPWNQFYACINGASEPAGQRAHSTQRAQGTPPRGCIQEAVPGRLPAAGRSAARHPALRPRPRPAVMNMAIVHYFMAFRSAPTGVLIQSRL